MAFPASHTEKASGYNNGLHIGLDNISIYVRR